MNRKLLKLNKKMIGMLMASLKKLASYKLLLLRLTLPSMQKRKSKLPLKPNKQMIGTPMESLKK